MQLELWILFRLVVAALLGGLVGYEREATGKRAGLRTHILVAIGAALFTSITDLSLIELQTEGKRIAPLENVQIQVHLHSAVQAVATGVGFLGAGTIFFGGRHNRVHGLTTAASIWGIAAVGVAVAFDRFVLAIGATLLILFVLHVLVRLDSPRDREMDMVNPPGV